jgi:hypothetical protein
MVRMLYMQCVEKAGEIILTFCYLILDAKREAVKRPIAGRVLFWEFKNVHTQ